jgi:predicted kinase
MDLKEEFIKRFPIPKGNKESPYLILFDAYTGMGKSTVSKAIAKLDGSVILNNDEVREFLNDHEDARNIRKELQNYRLELLLKNGNSCIMDSCFCHNWQEKKKYYDELGYKYFVIRLICREEVVKERLQKRTQDGENYSIATFKDYMWMKENVSHVDDELIDFVIDTEEDIEKQAKEFLEAEDLL